MFRFAGTGLEVLLAHPGGPFWAHRDEGAWTIPKGEWRPGEEPQAAARREFEEETGIAVEGELIALAPCRQKGGKIVHAWAVEGNVDPAAVRSNTFQLGAGRSYPEIDRVQWFSIPAAKEKINAAQAAFLDELQRTLGRDQ